MLVLYCIIGPAVGKERGLRNRAWRFMERRWRPCFRPGGAGPVHSRADRLSGGESEGFLCCVRRHVLLALRGT